MRLFPARMASQGYGEQKRIGWEMVVRIEKILCMCCKRHIGST